METPVAAALAAKHKIPVEVAAELALDVAQRCALTALRYSPADGLGALIGAELIKQFTPPLRDDEVPF